MKIPTDASRVVTLRLNIKSKSLRLNCVLKLPIATCQTKTAN